jgi:N-dimethylarginine dimethylaminohydrolase
MVMAYKAERILMCPPDYFSVENVINPWMAGNEGQLDLDLARRQWDGLHDALAEVADIELLDPQPGLPDLVFTANAGFVCGTRAVPSHFMPHERRPEEAYLKSWLAERGFELCVLPDDVGFEGAGDCLIDRGGPWMWTGFGFRTEIEAHAILADWFAREVVSIRLTDAHFYHIDTCLCPLSGGYLLYYPEAFDAASIGEIERRIPPERRISISAEDAANFACNAVNVAEHVFLHDCSSGLEDELSRLGFKLHRSPLSEFLKSGGSAKCLTLRLSETEE